MLKIVTCFKWVIDEAYIRMNADGGLNLSLASYKISDYDRNAIEEAVLLQERFGASVTAVTVASPTAKSCLKDVLSRGADRALFVNDPSFTDLEPAQTSSLLARAIKVAAEFDLILCGEGSSDLYAQYVGPALAENLGIPCVTYVNKLDYHEGEGTIVAERKLEREIEVVSCALPALITVLPDINAPRIPTLKQVLGAAKKPVESIGLEAVGPLPEALLETVGVLAATMERKRLRFGPGKDDIGSVVRVLRREGVIA